MAPKGDPGKYEFVKSKGQRCVRLDGELAGGGFRIESCEDCEIFLLDRTCQVLIDDCKRCTFVIGPVDGSVFFRESVGCKMKVACRQFRTRDCEDCDILVAVPGQPIIEKSHDMRFGPLKESFAGISQQMEAAGLAAAFAKKESVCRWRKVYDFSCSNTEASQKAGHWRSMSAEEAGKVAAAFPAAPIEGTEAVNASFDGFPEDDEAPGQGDGAVASAASALAPASGPRVIVANRAPPALAARPASGTYPRAAAAGVFAGPPPPPRAVPLGAGFAPIPRESAPAAAPDAAPLAGQPKGAALAPATGASHSALVGGAPAASSVTASAGSAAPAAASGTALPIPIVGVAGCPPAGAAAPPSPMLACWRCRKAPDAGEPALMLCAGCGLARFCGYDCQKAAWKAHKPECQEEQRRREARAAALASAGGEEQ